MLDCSLILGRVASFSSSMENRGRNSGGGTVSCDESSARSMPCRKCLSLVAVSSSVCGLPPNPKQSCDTV